MSAEKNAARVRRVGLSTAEFAYRTPIKFGGVALDRVTVLTATVEVEDASGRRATGLGEMPLGNVWAFPSRLGYAATHGAMHAVAVAVAGLYESSSVRGHPVEITHALEPQFWPLAGQVGARLALAGPVPKLATLVAASPIDAALHDAYGKLHGQSVYALYGPEFLPGDLGRFLGGPFRGRTLDEFVLARPRERMPVYHLVGALDALTDAECAHPVHDGLPNSLAGWIRAEGVHHLKIKLDGADAAWDAARIDAVAAVATAELGDNWVASLDFNERVPSASALVQFLTRLRRDRPATFARVQYVEQPLPRDLFAPGAESVAEANRLKTVVVDESLDGPESLLRAVELGYGGAAFKACKGQTQSLLLAAMADHLGLFQCVQDLTCPGRALVQSAGLAARLPHVVAIEANARQYVPSASAGWEARLPGLFTPRGGFCLTGQLTGVGLGGGRDDPAPAGLQ